MQGARRKLDEQKAKGRRGCGVCAKGWRRWWHSIASSGPSRDPRRRCGCGAYGEARTGLLAFLAMVSQAGLTLADLALARESDKEALASLASSPAWLPFTTGASAWVVVHHSDPSFGAGARR